MAQGLRPQRGMKKVQRKRLSAKSDTEGADWAQRPDFGWRYTNPCVNVARALAGHNEE